MSIRSIIILAALCAAPLTVAAAQQITDAAPTTAAPAIQATEASPASGPRMAPPMQREEPKLAPSRTAARSAYLHKENHTIVLSTLALVLAVVLIVVLIVR